MTATRPKPKRKKAGKRKPLGTIWEVPDALWERILPILQEFWPTKPTGRHHADWRQALNGIIFRMRFGLPVGPTAPQVRPQEHRPRLVPALVRRAASCNASGPNWSHECDELGAVDWQWQAADGLLGKARFGGEKGGQKPHGSREKGHQEERAG